MSIKGKDNKTSFGFIISHLQKRSIDTDDEIYLYLISLVAISFCLVTHIYLLILFNINNCPVFIYANIVSLCIYAFSIYLSRIKKYKFAVTLISLEVTAYASLNAFLTGISTYAIGYYILVIILQLIIPYKSRKMPLVMIAIVLVTGTVGILHSMTASPTIIFEKSFHDTLTLSNIYLLFTGTVVQLIIGNVIRRIIAENNKIKIEILYEQANTDHLTGLLNRRSAEIIFDDIMQNDEKTPYCIAMLDIDDFKKVNDTLGHAVGDEVLVFLANLLKSNLRRSDLIFRWGGEEFLIVLKNTELTFAQMILDKLRKKIKQSVIETSSTSIYVTVTIGVTMLSDGDTVNGSIEQADRNMYLGKKNGKNTVVAG